MMLSPPLKNFHLSGDAQKRSRYSSVNHDIQTASTIAKSGLSCGVPLWKCCNDGIVFSVRAIVDRTMKSIDITAIIWKSSAKTKHFFLYFSNICIVIVLCWVVLCGLINPANFNFRWRQHCQFDWFGVSEFFSLLIWWIYSSVVNWRWRVGESTPSLSFVACQ